MMTFNNINHTVYFRDASLKLQPLTYKLLEKLAASPGEIIAVDDLIKSVWGSVIVSPDTLKQRVFVLRKAIDASEFEGISIQGVRSEGYRLIVDIKTTNSPKNKKYTRWGLIGLTTTLVLFSLFGFFMNRSSAPINDRVVLWTNIPMHEMPAAAAGVYEYWRSLLTAKNNPGKLQLIFSDRQKDIAVPIQARKNRAALISHFEVATFNDSLAIRLSIIEPTTATVLRSDILSIFDEAYSDETYKNAMQQQFDSIEALIASGKLRLQNAQRDNAQDPIWHTLKQLANPE